MSRPGLRTDELRSHAELVVRACLQEGAATEAELAPHQPGGALNTGGPDDAGAWLRLYTVAHRYLAAAQGGRARDETVDPVRLDALLMQTLGGEPQPLELLVPPSGVEPVVAVHPKSWQALRALRTIDETIAWLATYLQALRQAPHPEVALLDRAAAELHVQHQRAAWLALTPGPGLPWTSADDPVPDWVAQLDVLDLTRIAQAVHQVNVERAIALGALELPPHRHGRAPRLEWATFFGALAQDLKVPARHLLQDRALVTVLAEVRLHRVAEAEAMAAASEGGR